jgi:predicted O-methyltransferase YrrM
VITTDLSARSDPFAAIQARTRRHQREHGCGAYTFEDGLGLTTLAAAYLPKKMLELGTALGYTACCLASGSPEATVDTLEADEEHVRLARREISNLGLAGRIHVHQGTFERILPKFAGSYDLVFFDGFAPSLQIIRALREQLVSGGLLVCSNTQLMRRDEAALLWEELRDQARWEKIHSIERNQTAVMIKR